MDSIAIENELLRAMTKDPKNFKDLEKDIKFIKKMIVITLIVASIGGFFAFRTFSALEQLAEGLNIVIRV
jgi:hypothetical protein